MDIAEASSFKSAREPVEFAKHEQARAIGIGWRRRLGHVSQNDPSRGGEKGLLFLAPSDERGAPARLQHAEALAQCYGQIGKKHNAEAASEDIEGFAGEREGLRAGFAEFDVGDAFLAREFLGYID